MVKTSDVIKKIDSYGPEILARSITSSILHACSVVGPIGAEVTLQGVPRGLTGTDGAWALGRACVV